MKMNPDEIFIWMYKEYIRGLFQITLDQHFAMFAFQDLALLWIMVFLVKVFLQLIVLLKLCYNIVSL